MYAVNRVLSRQNNTAILIMCLDFDCDRGRFFSGSARHLALCAQLRRHEGCAARGAAVVDNVTDGRDWLLADAAVKLFGCCHGRTINI